MEGVEVGLFIDDTNDTTQTEGYEKCEKRCDNQTRCRSFTYCPRQLDCFLYGKVVYGNETLNVSRPDDCYSNYRSPCKTGISKCFSISLEDVCILIPLIDIP